ncbi:hypothetical protein PMPD1_1901 [Paramixta manurensis]|uniref:DUF2231 domain-containing protein n=1 Tax=Paramixta manurensis TaxID=2740817 RepID=A0A6M8UD39_9GAMM|nr:hypothetical protein PMPD1_1901 [Erwiniaceae bacterium PD-1]
MNTNVLSRRGSLATVIYELLNPIPYGFFIAALVFDIIYVYSTNVMWEKSASWLITLGLISAIIPRLINLFQVWVGHAWPQLSAVKIAFWLNVVAIIAAIFNAFVHSRDAYAVAPQNLIYSVITVACLLIAALLMSCSQTYSTGDRHE